LSSEGDWGISLHRGLQGFGSFEPDWDLCSFFSEVISMMLPKIVRGVNRGASAVPRYGDQSGVEPAILAGCRWDGTAPICSGSCNPGEIQVARGNGGEGALCFTGSKAACCEPRIGSLLRNCRWDGTGPFCSGSCQPGEVTVAVDSDGDGAHCFSGTKSLCCQLGL